MNDKEVNAIACINMAKDLIGTLYKTITTDQTVIKNLTKEQMAKIVVTLSDLSGTMIDVGVKVGMLEGKVDLYEKLINKQQLPQSNVTGGSFSDMLTESGGTED